LRPHLVAALLVLGGCSRSTEGPIPKLTGTINPLQRNVTPARVCNAQGGERGWLIDLEGERFTPIPQDVLTDEPTVGLPEVTLKGPTTVTLARDHVFYRDPTLLRLQIPTRDTTPPVELPEGTYSVEVRNLGGGVAEQSELLIVVPPPVATRVRAPEGFFFGTPTPITVEGTGFRTDSLPAMKLIRAGSPEVELFALTVDSATRVTTELPPGTPEGTYDFVISNPEGCEHTLPGALTITYERLGTLTIEPRSGWQLRNQPVTIHNAPSGTQRAFENGTPRVFLMAPLKTNPAETVALPLKQVTFVSPTTLTAVVPTCSGHEEQPTTAEECPNGVVVGGPYALRVADPSGAVGDIPAASGFSVLQNEPILPEGATSP
jgi:hypothetical protein